MNCRRNGGKPTVRYPADGSEFSFYLVSCLSEKAGTEIIIVKYFYFLINMAVCSISIPGIFTDL